MHDQTYLPHKYQSNSGNSVNNNFVHKVRVISKQGGAIIDLYITPLNHMKYSLKQQLEILQFLTVSHLPLIPTHCESSKLDE